MTMRVPRQLLVSVVVGFSAAIGGAFIALAIDDGDTTIIQQPPAAAVATVDAAAQAPILESPPMIRISGPADAAYPMRIFEQVALSVVLVQTPTGGGSGFFVDTQGHLITNYHVIQGNDEVVIVLGDGSRVRGEVLGASPDNDLAVVKIDPSGLRIVPVHLGDSDALVVGDRVAAIGNPFGLERTLTTGVVSALDRELPPLQEGLAPQQGAIQTDTAINPGNSGGPLINMAGEVVGVTSAAFSPVAGSVGVNFAIPINTVARLLPDLTEGAVGAPSGTR